MKGILLAGGSGTRLAPITSAVSKQLLPVYDKPVIYYPLSTLMMAGIKEILVISTPRDLPLIKQLLKDGSDLGIRLEYIEQPSPDGIAQAFILGEQFIDGEPVCLILGDNIFYGQDLPSMLKRVSDLKDGVGARVLAYQVNDPMRYGVVEFGDGNAVVAIEEKPKMPKSNWAITGIYFYDSTVVAKAKSLSLSRRGELEISDINRIYLAEKTLEVEKVGRGFAWLDTGTFDSLLSASVFVQTIEQRQGLKICCPEEVALDEGFIDGDQLAKLAEKNPSSGYGDYLKRLLNK